MLTINSVPGFKKTPDQGHLSGLLATLIQNRTMPHAILFSGMAGLGKQALAFQLAMACNCRQPDSNPDALESETDVVPLPSEPSLSACGRCNACRKILLGNHPDLICIKPQGAFIRIESIRELTRIFSLKSYEGRIRIAIVLQADRLNPSAGNALLKILEEPPDSSLLILTTENPSELLPTIVSRCRHMKLAPVSSGQIQTEIQKRYEMAENPASAVAKMCGGSPAKAFAMVENGWLDKRNLLFQRFSNRKPLSIRETLLIAKAIALQENPGGEEMEILRSWYRDAEMAGIHPSGIIHRDWKPQLQQAASVISTAELDRCLDAINRIQKIISGNANTRLHIETLMLELQAEAPHQNPEAIVQTTSRM